MKKLKLFFACLLMAVLSIGQVWADEVSFAPSDFSGKGTPNTGSEMSVTKDGVTVAIGKGYGTTEIRAYSGSSFSISSSNTITALSFTFSGGKTGGMNTSYTDLNTTEWSQTLSSQARFSNITVTYTAAAPSTPTLSVSPTVIDFGTVDQGASVEAQEVTVTYENLTGAVTYSELSGAFAASGAIAASGSKITITPNTDNTGNFQQTLTVTSADDSKSAEVTVKMNVVEPFDGLKLTFDVSSNPGEWPTTNSTTTTDYTYTLNEVDYTFALNNVKCNSGYLMLYSVAKLGLPAISGYKLVKVEATNSSGCSTTTQVSVSSSDATKTDVTGGTAQTWGTTSTKYTYNLSGTEENTMYYLWIANKNCQLVELTLYYEEAEAATVTTPVISGTESFLTSTEVSIACTTDGATVYYTTDGTDPKTSESKQPYSAAFTLTNTATVRAIATKDAAWSSEATSKTFTKITPMTVAEALTALDSENPIDNVAVAGIISTAPTSNPSSGKLTYYISDDGTDTDELEVFLGFGLNGASFSDKTDLQVGDEVTVFGNLTIYVKNETSTKEFAAGSHLLAFNRPQVDVESISLTESTAEVEEGKTVTLHASVVPANATNKTIVWSVQSGNEKAEVDANGVVTGIAAGEAVIRAASDEDATIFAECTITVTEPAPLSPWATTYTSNVAMAHTGSGVDNGTITIGTDDPYLLVKAGASSSTGTIVVTVPKGTTDLHFHAFAWGGKTAKIELAGVENASVSEFDLAGEAGASGSGNDFTLQGDPVDQYFHVSFDAVAAETEITFSKATGSADNRFFFYGVNQEGGLILESISVSGTATALEYNEGDHFSPAGLGVIGHYSDASTAPITEGVVWAFDPDPLTEGTTSVSVTATAGGFTSDPFVVNGLTVSGAAPLSPWATVYTSNVTMAHTGSGVDNGTITIGTDDPYLLVKAGASSSTGTIVVTVPKGTTDLHFHAFAWGGKTAKIELAGVENASVSEFDLAGEAGASGSGNDFTLQSDPVDQYFHVSFDAVAAVTEITFSKATGSADNRFFFYGVNQEGGIVPVLKSIAISGDLDNKSYKAGQALDMTGLTVTATYQLGEETPYNVDITSDAGLTWTYAPLAEGDTQKEVTANFGGMTANKTIEGLTVASADPKIYVSTLNVNFASVEVGDAVPAAQTITVNLTNIASVTATLGGTNPEAFSISKTEGVVDGDEITISLLANTDAAASYAATLTISDGEGGADDKTVNLSFAVTEPVVTEEYQLVSDVTSLAAGDQVIIVAENEGDYYTLDGSISSQYFPSTTVSIAAGIITAPSTSAIILGKDGGNWTMSMGGQLIGATAAKKASLGNNDASNTWTIAIAENVATIANTTEAYGKLQFNYNNGTNPRFLNYASVQTAVAIYKKVAAPEPTPDYTREVTNGHYGTICLPKAGTIEGATLYEIGAFENNLIYIDEVGTTLEAGVPYIFYASGAQLNVYYTDKTAGDVPADDANGLIGFYDLTDEDATFDIPKDAENYILYNDQYWLVSGRAAYIANYRAYIKRGSIVPKSAAPGRRRVAMAVNGENAATGFENIESGDAPMKVMIDGTMYILRGEKVYDATGRLVK